MSVADSSLLGLTHSKRFVYIQHYLLSGVSFHAFTSISAEVIKIAKLRLLIQEKVRNLGTVSDFVPVLPGITLQHCIPRF